MIDRRNFLDYQLKIMYKLATKILTLIWVGFLRVRLEIIPLSKTR